ncbi:hypothetical protein KAR91_28015 [Candidatus Pacearchaeota archaeon]|nr:hypothetical protein [Candidatus Pacearchaeota archaeon]
MKKASYTYNLFPQTVSIIIVLLLFFTGTSCSKKKQVGSDGYRLAREGYSSLTNNLLLGMKQDSGEGLYSELLAIYDDKRKSVDTFLELTDPFDFAWSPKHDVFIVTHDDRISIFEKIGSSRNYNGTAIQCPLGALYTYCSWNPNGECLTVSCFDLRRAVWRLGFYRMTDRKFVMSDISIAAGYRPVWVNNTALYLPGKNYITEVQIDSGKPQIVRTVSLDEEITAFYGIFNNQFLVVKDQKLQLGNKILSELGQANKRAVITTQKFIFASVPPESVVLFDYDGNYLDKVNVRSIIKFGSVSNDPNIVYALAKDSLLRLCVKNNVLDIHTIGDLSAMRIDFSED